jgi:hypothetical protein
LGTCAADMRAFFAAYPANGNIGIADNFFTVNGS